MVGLGSDERGYSPARHPLRSRPSASATRFATARLAPLYQLLAGMALLAEENYQALNPICSTVP